MRRLLSLSLCVATTIGLTACDQEPVEPTTDDEQELFEFRAGPAAIPGYEGDGDIEVTRPSNNLGGGEIILVDLVGPAAIDAEGVIRQNLVGGTSIADPKTGETMCTTGPSPDGVFLQLRDQEGTVLFSTVGRWVFDGAPDIAGKNPWQVYQELNSTLRFSFFSSSVAEGHPGNGDLMATASAQIQHATGVRKLMISSNIDGYCGGVGDE